MDIGGRYSLRLFADASRPHNQWRRTICRSNGRNIRAEFAISILALSARQRPRLSSDVCQCGCSDLLMLRVTHFHLHVKSWEALYVGRIPVISSTPIDHLFADLPVVIVKDWSQLSRAFLLDAHARIEERRKRGDYNFEQLSPRFWAGKVLEQSAYAALGLRHEERPGRCWAVV